MTLKDYEGLPLDTCIEVSLGEIKLAYDRIVELEHEDTRLWGILKSLIVRADRKKDWVWDFLKEELKSKNWKYIKGNEDINFETAKKNFYGATLSIKTGGRQIFRYIQELEKKVNEQQNEIDLLLEEIRKMENNE